MAEQNKNTQQNELPRVDLRPGGGPGKGGPMGARVHVEKPKNIKKSTIYISSFSFRAVCTNAYDFFVYYDNPRCEKTLRFPIFFQYFLFFS